MLLATLQSPLLARNGPAEPTARCPLTGVERKSSVRGQTDANDVVDDARSGIECAKGVIVEQRIT